MLIALRFQAKSWLVLKKYNIHTEYLTLKKYIYAINLRNNFSNYYKLS